MKEVKSPKKPLLYYYGIVLLILVIFVCKKDLIVLDLNVFDFFLFNLGHKGSIVYFSDRTPLQSRSKIL